MKKILIVVVIVLAVAVYFFAAPPQRPDRRQVDRGSTPGTTSPDGGGTTQAEPDSDGIETRPDGAPIEGAETRDEDGFFFEDDTPAPEKYKTADEALKAAIAGAKDYDDLVIQRFVEVGECSWCDKFFDELKAMMRDPKQDLDSISYYGEILAVTGNLNNIESIVDGMETARDEEVKDAMAEALELTIGGDDVVQYLSEHMNSEDELLQESAVAAVSNQGSRLAVELLYLNAVESGDPDGYYSLGIGLGEVIPDEDAIPVLNEYLLKRDQYSHLAAKALVNSGLAGLALVIDSVSTIDDVEYAKNVLDGTYDHAAYDEESEEYLRKLIRETRVDFVRTYAEGLLKEFELEAELEKEGF